MANNTFDKNLLDLEIRISPQREEGYLVEITLGGQQEFRGVLAADVLPWIPSNDLAADGRRLFETLLADSALRSAWAEARGQSPQRRIRLRIDPLAAELHTLPWELLQEGPVMLSAQTDTPFSRYLPVAKLWGGPVGERPIRLLVVISDPTDIESKYGLPRANVELERNTLQSAFEAVDPSDLQVDFLDAPVTLVRLEEKLREGYHILHYLGHGAFSEKRGQAVLFMQDDERLTKLVYDDELSSMVARRGIRPQLIFLAACQSATRSTEDAFLGIAPNLVSVGVPAVVAMQELVSVESALRFSRTFYRRLLEHGLVDVAVNEARSTLLTAGRPDAAVPVLFMRLKSGQLWRGETVLDVDARPSRFHIVPFHAPPLPPHFIPRPEISEPLKNHLLADEDSVPGILAVSAIHGPAGIGKSTLAAALAHDKDVRRRFPDGVLWATLGQEPALLPLLNDWGQALMGEDFFHVTVDAAATGLRSLLQDKTALLVVDDAWESDHARLLLVGGSHCQVLITTRRADVADDLGAARYQLDMMTAEQSLALLSRSLRRSLGKTEQIQAGLLAVAVGHLPMALEQAAARVARGEDWKALLDALNEEVARLEKLEGPRRRLKGEVRLEASFNLSLSALRGENERAWRAFVQLGVLPEDALVTAPIAAVLWKVKRSEAADLLELLWNDALLRRESPVRIGERTWPSCRLHSLWRDMVRRLLTSDQPEGLALTLEEARTQFIESLREEMPTAEADPAMGRYHAFWLMHLRWLDYVRLSAEELLSTLNLIARYVTPQYSATSHADQLFLVKNITQALKMNLSDLQQAQLLIYQAGMLGELGDSLDEKSFLVEAEERYSAARKITDRLIRSESALPEVHMLAVRVELGEGNLYVIRAGRLTQEEDQDRRQELLQKAVATYQAAIPLAQECQQDSVLEVTTLNELSWTYANLHIWEAAKDSYHKAFRALEKGKTDDKATYKPYRARVLETAGEVHWSHGQSLVIQKSISQAINEYATACKYAREAIEMLERDKEESEELVFAYYNLGKYLWAMSECGSQTADEACQNWRIAMNMAQRLGIPKMERKTDAQLREHC